MFEILLVVDAIREASSQRFGNRMMHRLTRTGSFEFNRTRSSRSRLSRRQKRVRGFRSPWLGLVACLALCIASGLQCFGMLPGSRGISVDPDRTLGAFADRIERAVLEFIGQEGSGREGALGIGFMVSHELDAARRHIALNGSPDEPSSGRWLPADSASQPNPYYP